ncbi:MAG: translation initiation factor IF-2 [Candidatus Cloacimonetes bacterium]|nr:translation initiation factor IF-2 [Candidatus Cloacimonadota bacterium]
MGIRVHELAKELKISTSALKTHLKHLNIDAKSPFTQLEDDVVEKIRGIFKTEHDNMKRMEEEKRRIHDLKKKQRQQEQEAEEKRKEELEAVRKLEESKKKTPVFVEMPISKQKEGEETPVKDDKRTKARTPREKTPRERSSDKEKPGVKPTTRKPITKGKPQVGEKKLPDIPTPLDDVEAKKLAKAKKTEKKELEEKAKHLQAKIKYSKKGKGKAKLEPTEIEEAEISRSIKQTLAKQKKKKYKKDDKKGTEEELSNNQNLVVNEYTSVNELAKMMDIAPTEIIANFFNMGKIVTINQRLDKESLEMICDEFDFNVTFAEEYGTDIIEEATVKHKDAKENPRPPIVTIMGHVDHGKTSILDYIRSTNVIAGEAGGITQHIGAYQVDYKDHKITFIDTPGHEAFTAMRARGAHLTDIAVIVVAANDGVKPQTVEAIDHAKASGVDIVVAINKVDLKTANVDKTITGLSKQNVFLEGYGGNTLWTTCSALTGEGIDNLLEAILLAAEMKELKAKYDIPGSGIVIEAEKDSRIGSLVTILLKEGKIRKGDAVVCGATYGKIRKMENERGQEMKEIGPSDVALIYGLSNVPKAGDIINKVASEKIARQISLERKQIRHERERYIGRTNLDNLYEKIKLKEMNDLKIIVKADTDGSLEAFCDSLQKLSNEEVLVNIIHKGVGSIVEADINLAAASNAIILGFQVRTETKAKKMSEDMGIEIRTYQIIYDGINDIQLALEGLTEPEFEEKFIGSAIVKEVFRIKGVGSIAGCAVDKGYIKNDSIIRLYRNNGLIHEGKISSLKHFANDVEEVRAGSECGIGIQNYNDIKEGDVIEAYQSEEVKKGTAAEKKSKVK